MPCVVYGKMSILSLFILSFFCRTQQKIFLKFRFCSYSERQWRSKNTNWETFKKNTHTDLETAWGWLNDEWIFILRELSLKYCMINKWIIFTNSKSQTSIGTNKPIDVFGKGNLQQIHIMLQSPQSFYIYSTVQKFERFIKIFLNKSLVLTKTVLFGET